VNIDKGHRSFFSLTEIIHAISKSIENQIQNKMELVNFIGISCDDSNDISLEKNLIINATFLDLSKYETSTYFLDLLQLEEFDHESIFLSLKKSLQEKFLYEKVIFFNTDNAKVMSSLENGVAGKLKQEIP